jgi:hypothetical protein
MKKTNRTLKAANEKRLEHITEPVLRITTVIYESQNEWLEQAARQAHKSKAELIREAITDYQKKTLIV